MTPSLEYLILDLDSADSDALFIAGSASCGSWKRCFATSEKLKDVCWDRGSLQAYECRNFSLGAGGLGSTKLALLALEYTIFYFIFPFLFRGSFFARLFLSLLHFVLLLFARCLFSPLLFLPLVVFSVFGLWFAVNSGVYLKDDG